MGPLTMHLMVCQCAIQIEYNAFFIGSGPRFICLGQCGGILNNLNQPKPRSAPNSGSMASRTVARTFRSVLIQHPPLMTRCAPVLGPLGSRALCRMFTIPIPVPPRHFRSCREPCGIWLFRPHWVSLSSAVSLYQATSGLVVLEKLNWV